MDTSAQKIKDVIEGNLPSNSIGKLPLPGSVEDISDVLENKVR
jgi:hypothetical protein